MKGKPKNIRYLVIGPVLKADGSNVGGATVSLNYLVKHLEKKGIAHQLIDTKHFRGIKGKVLNPFYALFLFLKKVSKAEVVFVNLSQFGTKTIAPVFYILTRFWRKKLVFRPFGGAMQDHYEQYWWWQKKVFHKTLLQSDIFYLQTQQLCSFFQNKGRNIQQLPTSRYAPKAQLLRPNRPYQKRFVYLGHVNFSKGLWYLNEARKALDDSYTLDVFGPIQGNDMRQIHERQSYYKGVLEKSEVLKTLRQYDVLILPTHYRGEGHPGVILEAYSLGLPVITTKWRAIPEIVENGKTGFIISPQSTEELLTAIQHFEKVDYAEMSKYARAYFLKNHEAASVTDGVLCQIEALFQKERAEN